MIITCTSCKKKFEVDSNLIPEKGKLLQCGKCNHTWFFNRNDQENLEEEIILQRDITNESEEISPEPTKKQKKVSTEEVSNLPFNQGSELVKYQPKYGFTFGKILNYLIVFIISFVAVIIVTDTFKGPLSTFFPNIELILYNLFETLKDLTLFIKNFK